MPRSRVADGSPPSRSGPVRQAATFPDRSVHFRERSPVVRYNSPEPSVRVVRTTASSCSSSPGRRRYRSRSPDDSLRSHGREERRYVYVEKNPVSNRRYERRRARSPSTDSEDSSRDDYLDADDHSDSEYVYIHSVWGNDNLRPTPAHLASDS